MVGTTCSWVSLFTLSELFSHVAQVTWKSHSSCQSKVYASSYFSGFLQQWLLDVFSISGRGTVATGRVERGIATKGAEVEVVGLGAHFKTTLTGVGKNFRFLLRIPN